MERIHPATLTCPPRASVTRAVAIRFVAVGTLPCIFARSLGTP
jgi:hypothetical protein